MRRKTPNKQTNQKYISTVVPSHFTECSHGKFGHDCKDTCGMCLGEEQCHHINGTCLNGCDPGYYGTFCTKGIYKIILVFLIYNRNTYLHPKFETYLVFIFDVYSLVVPHRVKMTNFELPAN